MKVVLATPNFHQPRGNTVTVQRIADNLEHLGVQTDIVSTTERDSTATFPDADIVHGFHAYRFYTFMKQLGMTLDPYMITLTGTDLNHDLFDEKRRGDVLACLNGAEAVHAFDEKAKEILLQEAPKIKDKTYVIAQGNSDFPKVKPPIEKEENTFLFVLPAGIRKVKNVPSAINMLRVLHDKYVHVRLWLVGPILEEEEGDIVKELVDQHADWVQYLGQVPHSEMGAIYERADVVLNTSHSEGQSSALLEAMGYGIPVLVSDNQGNRNIVTHQETGFVYDTPNQFLELAEQIMNNDKLQQDIGVSAKQYTTKNHSGVYEAEALFRIYRSILHI
ncbi:glycosyltransferase family 4 protein [Aquibacillus sp. 3ASR75-11]|uniref:Glycosyltransferase family 4 protein n=1 Tax=Terrihalobacillus insolitus TaxID=2950438 RepID=A0A9X3WUF7_9BACI|nr:glycosyltransferase [Terrihalobacillus insolitus]MDC3414534.1 glycosyltransferase family 4 protein [Terrihalobacillus insolitus]MDC3426132.1 glycosyltransferase family 4 protein [Terrihalobacillus insolitus]